MEVFLEEFGHLNPEARPLLMALVITDGEAEDTNEFAQALRTIGERVYVTLAIIGYGAEHDQALRAYMKVAESNVHVKVLPFAGETDPSVIAQTLIKMIM